MRRYRPCFILSIGRGTYYPYRVYASRTHLETELPVTTATIRLKRTTAGLSVWTLLVVLLAGMPTASFAETRSLARSGEWELLMVEDPFADPKKACVLQSLADGPQGARRTRPRIRVPLGEDALFIDPTVTLTQAIRLHRRVVEFRDGYNDDRFTPANQVQHRLRVDEGEVHTTVIQDPDFGAWEVHEYLNSTADLVASMGSGRVLYYQWSMGPASETFEFALDGFVEMTRKAAETCP